MEPIKLSKSRVNAYVVCPYKYYLGYELLVWPLKKSSNLVLGWATHKIIEDYLRCQVNGCPFLLDKSQEAAWAEYPIQSTDYTDLNEYQDAMEQSLILAQLFISKVKTQPRMIEHPFELPMVNLATGEEREDIVWSGTMDHVDRRQEGELVVDIKTKAKKEDQFVVRTSFELTGYAYAYRLITGREEGGVTLINLIKTREPNLQRLKDYRDEDDFKAFFHTLVAVADGIRGHRYYRNPGIHCNFCDHKPICARDIGLIVKRFGEEAYERLLAQGI